ncbi:MAG: pitrilysin family protein [bacterium]
MNKFERYTLENGINTIIQVNKNTPRTSLEIFVKANNKLSLMPGLASIVARLLLQGSKTKTQEEIAQFIDENGIELNVEAKNDFLRVHAYCLNEDFESVLDFLQDILTNSTFESVQKECLKMEGEITAELDSPKAKAVDNLAKNMFEGHPYGSTYTIILKKLKDINKEAVTSYYKNIFTPENINIVVVGDVVETDILIKLNKNFGDLQKTDSMLVPFAVPSLKEDKVVTIAKEDVQQAQVLQGWIACSLNDPDYVALSLLNTILGSAGLSSRLFVELRDKKGLAYVVRSSFDAMKTVGLFTVYIATEPKNIQVSLEGFKEEIGKLQTEFVSDKELEDAKNNIIGKRKFFHETNSQKAYYLGYFENMEIGADFDYFVEEKIRKVTKEDIMRVANKYLSGASVISLLAPKEYLPK